MLSRASKIIVFLAASVFPAYAEGAADFCGANNGHAISECPQMCTPQCTDLSFVSRSAAIRDACRTIMGIDQSQRTDGPKCEELAVASADPCSALAMPTGDDAIPNEGEPPPACMHSFKYLQCRLEHLADSIKELNTKFSPMVERYRPLRQRLRVSDDQNSIEQSLCRISRQDMGADYRTSQTLDEEVKKLTKQFAQQAACIVATQEWISGYKFHSPIDKGAITDAIINNLKRRLAGPMQAQEVVQGLMADVDNSRSVIVDIYQIHRAVCGPEQN